VCDSIDNDCDETTSEAGTALFVKLDASTVDMTTTLTGTESTPAAVSLEEDGTLWVCEGTWYVHLDITANAVVAGNSGDRATVVLDGADAGTVVTMSGAVDVEIRDLTIQNGNPSGGGPCFVGSGSGCGGGLWCGADDTTTALLSNVVVRDSAAALGGGMWYERCAVEIEDSQITGNAASLDGGGVFGFFGRVEVRNSEISSNTASKGGGMYAQLGYTTLTNSQFTDNTAVNYGGGYSHDDSDTAIVGTLFSGNTADIGGGLYARFSTEAGPIFCDGSAAPAGFVNNVATSSGGVSALSVDLAFIDCDFGTSAGGDDNAPDDLHGSTVGDDYTATCRAGSCVDVTYVPLGGTGGTSSTDADLVGNVFLADTAATLDNAHFHAASVGDCTADFYVLSAATADATEWTVQAANLDVFLREGMNNTTFDPGVDVQAGTYYAVAWAPECSSGSATWSLGNQASNDVGFGDFAQRRINVASPAEYAESDTVTVTNSGSTTDAVVGRVSYSQSL